jgi:hypothetical protein
MKIISIFHICIKTKGNLQQQQFLNIVRCLPPLYIVTSSLQIFCKSSVIKLSFLYPRPGHEKLLQFFVNPQNPLIALF